MGVNGLKIASRSLRMQLHLQLHQGGMIHHTSILVLEKIANHASLIRLILIRIMVAIAHYQRLQSKFMFSKRDQGRPQKVHRAFL